MQLITHLRKMRTRLEGLQATYDLPQFNILEHTGNVRVNDWVGAEVSIRFTGDIHCIETGKKIRKTFGDGLSYDAWLTSPLASPSIIHPELSRIHEGIALRDKAWEEAHHLQPHVTYLSRTSTVKVGVTRTVNVPSRWIDQGASEAIVLAETPYRQLAGQIEVALKDQFADKTGWQKMLRGECDDGLPLSLHKDRALHFLSEDLHSFISDEDSITRIKYPGLVALPSIRSLKLESTPEFSGVLMGVKGQYLVFNDGRVFNVRAHSGYRIELSVGPPS